MNSIDDYQLFTPETFIYSDDPNIDLAHVQNGLQAEAGEIAAAYQKFYRGDYDEEELVDRLGKEIGGLLYYTAMMCNLEGLSMSSIMERNASILRDRLARNKIKGDGDNR